MAQTGKKRIDWIDTAKGICILLVVLQHVSNRMDADYPFKQDFLTFRMPLYFILSGLFFKTYEGFWGFTKRKTNKLLIPYIFFFSFGGVIIPVLLYHAFGISLSSYDGYGFEAFKYIFSEHWICNPSIWFLVCLFEVSILFYLIIKTSHAISAQEKTADILVVGLSLLMGIVGVLSYLLRIRLPYFIDSAFSALPFFAFGWLLRNKTNFLYIERSWSVAFKSIIFICLSVALIHFFNHGKLSILSNSYGGMSGVLQLYPYGIIGTLCVLSFSRITGKIPFISFVGRYSIIVLCTHYFAMELSNYLLSQTAIYNMPVMFLLTTLICALAIPVFKKYLGYFTAQKDLIKI